MPHHGNGKPGWNEAPHISYTGLRNFVADFGAGSRCLPLILYE